MRALGLFGTALPFGIAIVLACTYASGKNLSLFDEKVKWIKFGDFTAVDKGGFLFITSSVLMVCRLS